MPIPSTRRNACYRPYLVIPGGKVSSITRVRVEKTDKAEVGPKGNCIIFNFNNTGGIDGFDFEASSPVLEFSFEVDGKKLKPKHIYVGAGLLNPKKNPFILR